MSNTRLNRDYNGKDVEMLTACETLVYSAIANRDFLVSKHSSWSGTVFETTLAKVQAGYVDCLGVDNARILREASDRVYAEQETAIFVLADFKAEINSGFRTNKERAEQLLLILGYTKFLKNAQNGNQESLVELLYAFSDNMTADIRAEVIAAGTDEPLIDAVIAHAETMKNLNVTQENAKSTRKELTEAQVIALNAIYNEVMSIATLAKNYFRRNVLKQQLFSYTRILKTMN